MAQPDHERCEEHGVRAKTSTKDHEGGSAVVRDHDRPSFWNMLSSVLNATGFTRLADTKSTSKFAARHAKDLLAVDTSFESSPLVLQRRHTCQGEYARGLHWSVVIVCGEFASQLEIPHPRRCADTCIQSRHELDFLYRG